MQSMSVKYTDMPQEDELTIIIRIPKERNDLPLSDTGKTRSIASTRGNVPIEGAPDDIRLGLNLYSRVPKEQRVKKK